MKDNLLIVGVLVLGSMFILILEGLDILTLDFTGRLVFGLVSGIGSLVFGIIYKINKR